jgi:hypothetical protein
MKNKILMVLISKKTQKFQKKKQKKTKKCIHSMLLNENFVVLT